MDKNIPVLEGNVVHSFSLAKRDVFGLQRQISDVREFAVQINKVVDQLSRNQEVILKAQDNSSKNQEEIMNVYAEIMKEIQIANQNAEVEEVEDEVLAALPEADANSEIKVLHDKIKTMQSQMVKLVQKNYQLEIAQKKMAEKLSEPMRKIIVERPVTITKRVIERPKVTKIVRHAHKHKIVGNKISRKMHTEDCPFAKSIKRSNKEIFKTVKSAVHKRYSPCACMA
jgi:regulator of replication initiation timing